MRCIYCNIIIYNISLWQTLKVKSVFIQNALFVSNKGEVIQKVIYNS